MIKIAVNAICKNEYKFIREWYDSLKDEVDFITVLDTGSEDGTFELLKEIANEDNRVIVKQEAIKPWRFDKARNEALKLIPKEADVFISIDMDERFMRGFGCLLRENWKDSTYQAKYRYVWNHDEEGKALHCFTYSKIVRNDGGWVWKYPVHEILTRNHMEVFEDDAILDFGDSITLHHYQDTSVKRSSYLDLLKVRMNEYDDDMSILYYARELTFYNKYDDAISYFEKILNKKEVTLRSEELAYVAYSCGRCYALIGNLDNCIELLKRAIIIDKSFRDPYMELANIYIGKKEYGEARYFLKMALKNTQRKYSWVEVGNVWGVLIWDLLSVCSFNTDNKIEALSACAIARTYEPNNTKLLDNYNTILSSIVTIDFA